MHSNTQLRYRVNACRFMTSGRHQESAATVPYSRLGFELRELTDVNHRSSGLQHHTSQGEKERGERTTMAKKAVVKYRSLRSNLVHLPLSLFGSLAQQQVVSRQSQLLSHKLRYQRPQGIILHIAPLASSSSRHSSRSAYLGWSGLAAASSLAGIGGGMEAETVEMDPEVAMGLHWAEGTIVCALQRTFSVRLTSQVEISIIHSPVKAKSVSVTPLSSDDWEILVPPLVEFG